MPVPVALNIFDSGPRLWLSQRIDGTWVTELKVYDRDDGLGVFAFKFGAGATVAAQADNLGTVINGFGAGGPYFIGDGTTDPSPPVITDDSDDPIPGVWNHIAGARWIDGEYWYFGRTGVPKKVAARRSLDGVSWAEYDTANAPLLQNGVLHDTWWDEQNTVYCLVALPAPFGDPTTGQIFAFDTSSKTWSQETDAFSNMALLPVNYEHIQGFLVRHSNGDLGVVYPGHGLDIFSRDINGGIKYRLWNGASWSSEVAVKPAGGACGTVIYDPATELIYLFFYPDYGNQGVDGPGIAVVTISKSGTVSSDLFTFPNVQQSDGFGTGLIFDNTMMVPYDDYADVSNAVWEWDMALPISFDKKLLPTPAEETGGVPSCASLYIGPGGDLVNWQSTGANNALIRMDIPARPRLKAHSGKRISHT